MTDSYEVKTSGGSFWYKNGTRNVLHRTDGPAATYYKDFIEHGYKKGLVTRSTLRLKIVAYYEDGVRHSREKEAYVVVVEKTQEVRQKFWYFKGKLIYANNKSEFKIATRLKSFE